jgi:ppGpp synthetase/RelA/SpoT-type nucleotidyltranferase
VAALSAKALGFYSEYSQTVAVTRDRAAAAESFVREILARNGLKPYAITSRVKEPASLLLKLRLKQYKFPRRQIRDLIGIRVITEYADQVDPIVIALRSATELVVSKTQSVDKRSALGLREFGYRSVHLVVRMRKQGGNLAWYQTLATVWFEVQARSILEHAWAEIEHNAAYKSGISFPKDFRRTFAALAGTLELLDRQFMDLRRMQSELVDSYRRRYLVGEDGSAPWDAARLAGYLAAVRPAGQRASTLGLADIARVQALELGGLNNADRLSSALTRSTFKRRLGAFASLTGQSPEEVSDFVVAVIAASLKNSTQLKRQFPELFTDPRLSTVVA